MIKALTTNTKPVLSPIYSVYPPTRAQRCHDMRLKTVRNPRTNKYQRRPTTLIQWVIFLCLHI